MILGLDGGDWIAIVAIIVTLILFGVGQWIARRDRQARDKADTAALHIAQDAKRAVSIGNELAENANWIAVEAKLIAERTAAATEQHSDVAAKGAAVEELRALAAQALKQANRVSPQLWAQGELGESQEKKDNRKQRRDWARSARSVASRASHWASQVEAGLTSIDGANVAHRELAAEWESVKTTAQGGWGVM